MLQSFPDSLAVSARISPNMGHPNGNAFAVESLILGKLLSDMHIVNISMDGAQGFQCFDPIGHVKRTYVSRMPHFIGFYNIFKNSIVDIPMGIGKEQNTCQDSVLKSDARNPETDIFVRAKVAYCSEIFCRVFIRRNAVSWLATAA